MIDREVDPVDVIKFAAACVLVCQNQFFALQGSGLPAAGAALHKLRHLHSELSGAVARFCPEGHDPEVWATRYDDGPPGYIGDADGGRAVCPRVASSVLAPPEQSGRA